MGVNKTDCGNRFIINVKCYVTTNSVWPNHVNHTRVRVCACVWGFTCPGALPLEADPGTHTNLPRNTSVQGSILCRLAPADS